jgi:flagellar biosynthetic protein FliR
VIEIHQAQLEALIASFFWPFVRILALMSAAPILGHVSVPMRVKIGLSALFAVLIAPTLPDSAAISVGSAQGAVTLIEQVLIGVSMGLVLTVIFAAVALAGEVIGMQMGLNFAGYFDPQSQEQTTPLGSWLTLLTMLTFLAVNGHLMILQALGESFSVFPIGGGGLSATDWHRIALIGGEMFRIGVYAALPVIGAMLVCNIGMGVLARIAPQLNVLAISFSITLLVGLLVFMSGVPYIAAYLQEEVVRSVGLFLR